MKKFKSTVLGIFTTVLILNQQKLKGIAEIVYSNSSSGLTRIPVESIKAETANISLPHNQINHTKPSDFKKFTNLKILSLANNTLTIFPNLTFVGNSLTHVSLDYNLLTEVLKSSLESLKKVEKLSICCNFLTSIPDLSSIGGTLSNLNLQGNNISDVLEDTFNSCTALRQLYLQNNRITTFPNLSSLALSLSNVALGSNHISYIPSDLLESMLPLDSIYFPRNKVANFEITCGSEQKTLKHIVAGNNEFTEVPDISCISAEMETLVMRGNGLTKIDPRRLNFLSRKAKLPLNLDFSLTAVETILPLIGPLIEGLNIKCTECPLTCDARIAWMLSVPGIVVEGTCAGPAELKGNEVKHLTFANLKNAAVSQNEQMNTKLVSQNAISLSTPMVQTRTHTITECAMMCLKTFGCLFYNYRSQLDVGAVTAVNCYYSSPVSGVLYYSVEDVNEWSLYYVI